MSHFRNISINRKLTFMIMLASVIVLLMAMALAATPEPVYGIPASSSHCRSASESSALTSRSSNNTSQTGPGTSWPFFWRAARPSRRDQEPDGRWGLGERLLPPCRRDDRRHLHEQEQLPRHGLLLRYGRSGPKKEKATEHKAASQEAHLISVCAR